LCCVAVVAKSVTYSRMFLPSLLLRLAQEKNLFVYPMPTGLR
jgi:hypothetical protein